MAIQTLGEGVYFVSFADKTDTGVEKTKGSSYANTYVGARSRNWELAQKQALLEAQGVKAHNEHIQKELDALEKERVKYASDERDRYLEMWKENNKRKSEREEFNAESGEQVTGTTRYTAPGTTVVVGSSDKTGEPRGGGKGLSSKELAKEQSEIQNAVAHAESKGFDTIGKYLDSARSHGDLLTDFNSLERQDKLAVELLEANHTTKIGAGPDAKEKARAYVKSELEKNDFSLAVYNRAYGLGPVDLNDDSVPYSKPTDLEETSGTYTRATISPPKITTTTQRKAGHAKAGEYTPFEYDQPEIDFSEYDRRRAELKARRQEEIDFISRSREINREQFGPSIIGSLRGLARQDPRGVEGFEDKKQLGVLRDYLAAGNTLDDFYKLGKEKIPVPIKGAKPTTAVVLPAEARVERPSVNITGLDAGLPVDQAETKEKVPEYLQALRTLGEPVPEMKESKPKIDAHNTSLLKSFVTAGEYLKKPKALNRKIANAKEGSPAKYAQANITAWYSKDPSQRAPLKEIVADVAKAYADASPEDRHQAMSMTIALYKMKLDETSLK